MAYAVLDVLRGLALEAAAGRVTRQLSVPLLQGVAAGGRGAAARPPKRWRTWSGCAASSRAPRHGAVRPDMGARLLLAVLLTQHWAYAVLGCALHRDPRRHERARRRDVAPRDARRQRTAARALRGAADAVGAAEVVLANGMLPTLTRRWVAAQGRGARPGAPRPDPLRRTIAPEPALRIGMTGAMVALGLVLALNGLASGGSMVAGNMILARLLLPFSSFRPRAAAWVDALAPGAGSARCWSRPDAAPLRPRLAAAHPAAGGGPRRPTCRPAATGRSCAASSFTAEPGEASASSARPRPAKAHCCGW